MTQNLDALAATAVEATLAGGQYLRGAFQSGETDATHLDHDVKSSADTGAERQILDVIEREFPDHQLYAEESGLQDGDYGWIVDPLDGTNNFEAGLPTFASAVTLLVDGEPTVGVGRRRHDGRAGGFTGGLLSTEPTVRPPPVWVAI